jgi:LCP family protein required for cell wall assembly
MPAPPDGAPHRAHLLGRVVATVLAAAVVICTGVAWTTVRSFDGGIGRISSAALGGGGEDDGAVDILLVGVDSRTDAHGNPLTPEELATLRVGDDEATNTDTIILVRIPNNGRSATAISIPRDTYVAVPGGGKMKINGVYGDARLATMKELIEDEGMAPVEGERRGAQAGREALIETVAHLTGVTVDHYAEIGLLGFSLITDALGGVDVCLKEAVSEPLSGADFPAGWLKLNGPQALSFIRQRHDLPRGDLDRVLRQQVVMASLAHRVISGRTLSSPATLNRLENAVQRSVVLSDDWDVMNFVQQLQKLAAGNVAFATIPVLNEAGWSDDGMQSVVRIDPDEVKSWVSGLLSDQAQGKTEKVAYSPDKTTVDVLNASDVNGLAAAVSDILAGKGFKGGEVGNHDGGGQVDSSQVLAAAADDPGAQEVARTLGGLPVTADTAVPLGSVQVVLAMDYVGPGSGLEGTGETSSAASNPEGYSTDEAAAASTSAPPPSPVITAASDDPQCVN